MSPQASNEWLCDLAEGGGVEGSRTAIIIAGLINRHDGDQIAAMRRTRLVLDVRRVVQGPIGRPGLHSGDGFHRGPHFIDGRVPSDPDVRAALPKQLGIGGMDQAGKLRAAVEALKAAPSDLSRFREMWVAARRLPAADAARILVQGFGVGETRSHPRSSIREIDHTLLPGRVVLGVDQSDAELTIDSGFHAQDAETFEILGARAARRCSARHRGLVQRWKEEARQAYLAKALATGQNVQPHQIRFTGQTYIGLDLLPRLSDQGRASMSSVVLSTSTNDWMVDSTTHALGVPMPFTNPGVWWIRKHGLLSTAIGAYPAGEVLAPTSRFPRDLLPMASVDPGLAHKLGLKESPEHGDWPVIITRAVHHLELPALHRLYGLAASEGADAPKEVKVSASTGTYWIAPAECVVSGDPHEYRSLITAGHFALLVQDPGYAQSLQTRWDVADAAGLIDRTVRAAPSGDASLLTDTYPGLRAFSDQALDLIELVPCSEISSEIVAGRSDISIVNSHSVLVQGSTVYFRDNLAAASLLELLDTDLRLGLGASQREQVLKIGARQSIATKKLAVRRAPSLADKVVQLAGEDAVRRAVPSGAIELVEQRQGHRIDASQLVEMAYASNGAELLKKLSPALIHAGIDVPSQLAGGTTARQWVNDWGLPEEFAGQRDARPPSREEILRTGGAAQTP